MDFLLGAKNNELPKKKISEVLKEAPQRAKQYEQLQKIKNKNFLLLIKRPKLFLASPKIFKKLPATRLLS